MAARKHLSHDQRTREKIQTSQLVNRLENHAFGQLDLTTTQIKAIEILIRKTLPDLQAVTHSGDPSNPLVHEIRRTFDSPPNTNG